MSAHPARRTGVILILGTVVSISGWSAAADEYRLESATLPAPFVGEKGKADLVIEASAAEPIGDGRRFLLAHDKHPALFIVDAATGRLVGEPITSPRFPVASWTGGPKWEGMARDGDGTYYVIGAHVGKTEEERASKSVLLRFRLKDGDAPAIDDASVIRWDISRSLASVLSQAGLSGPEVAKRKVEGLAIRESTKSGGSTCRELVIGLREPSDKVRAYAADIASAPSPDAELELKPVFTFDAEPRERVTSQLTSLAHVPALGGFLVTTASEDDDNAFHGNILWFVADGQTSQAQKIATFEVAMKAEGLAVLGVEKDARRAAVKLLITYDNDPHATKIPSRFQTVTLVREP
jgi:hypothetical protein